MKMLHKFLNKQDIPWFQLIWSNIYNNGSLPPDRNGGSFWWKDILKTLPAFLEISNIIVGYGTTIHLWRDKWKGIPLCDKFPELYSYTVNTNITFNQVKMVPMIEGLFHLPLSAPAYGQMLLLGTMLHEVGLSDTPDKLTCANNSDKYSSQKVYKLIHETPEVPDTFAML
jgi:hypothetical protein